MSVEPQAIDVLKRPPDTTFWEQVAATRWGAYVSEVEQRGILEAQSLAGKPGRALEMGCEGGRWSKLLSDLGWQMVCVDINPEVLSVCQRKVPGAKCILAHPGDQTIPCAPDSLDLLLCIEVAPVIERGWFFAEAARVLRNGGILAGVVQNRTTPRAMLHAMRNKIGGTMSEFYQISYRSWRTSLCQAGFQLAREEGFCWGPLGRDSNSPLVPLFTRLERLLGLRQMTTFSPWIMVIARKTPAGR